MGTTGTTQANDFGQGGDSMTQLHSPDPLGRHEALSALADGMLPDDAVAEALALLAQDAAAGAAWYGYHAIGDALRAPQAAIDPAHDAAFVARFRQRLALELAVDSAPVTTPGAPATVALPVPPAGRPLGAREAANDGLWRWKLVAGLASLSTAAVLAWAMGLAGNTTRSDATLAQSQPPRVAVASAQAQGPVWVNSPNGVVLRDPVLDEMLAAHHQLGGNSALQMPSGFLRNATFEGAAR